MSTTPSLRQRVGKEKAKTNGKLDRAESLLDDMINSNSPAVKNDWDYKVALAAITGLAFLTRFWGISHPDEVVFDEVHFGKFASYYLQRTYFFDVHPPLGKLLFALMGWLVGFDGHFLFDNIGDNYIDNRVPYVAYRALPALLGSLTVPTVFLIMWESGYSLPASVLAAGLLLFDNSHIGQTRLILLDATLVFFMAVSVLSYVRFYKQRHEPFGAKWWKWLMVTGFCMSCVISVKYVGLFIFVTIGCAVALDLWDLLDINRKKGALDLATFAKHFAARAFGLIIMPFIFYLFWFQVHFTILAKSGPGDDFMTPEFQETLADNAMHAQAIDIFYHDPIAIRHKDTKVYLHSHNEQYPLRYEDGRISSQGQQVTGYPFNDTNNFWEILPRTALPENDKENKYIYHNDVVQLRHIGTNTMLLSHDVASPYYPTNQEFTTVSMELATGERFNDTLFELKIDGGKRTTAFKSHSGQFRLVHYPSKVAMWTHTTPLPEWGFKQAEINGNKAVAQTSNLWLVDEVLGIPSNSPRLKKEPKKIKHVPFLKKYFELQRAMFHHNNALTADHPYASQPFQWPFLLRGVSFWTQDKTRQQIYYLGNPLGYWIVSALLAVFAGIVGADQLSLRRGVDALDHRTRSRFYNSTGFFFICWAAHYFPFYLMGRQLFLHHYLPAHLASCLVTGALIEFIFNVEPVIEDVSSPVASSKKVGGVTSPTTPAKKQRRGFVTANERFAGQSLLTTWAAVGAILAVVIWGWWFFLPLTYGYPGLSVAQVNARKWLGYDLHFAK